MFVVRVQVLGAVYEIPAETQAEAERLVREIKKNGYRHFEGNAVTDYPPTQIKDIKYIKE